MAVVGRRQPPLVLSGTTAVSMMEPATLADLHGTTGTRDDEWFDVVAPHEYFSLLSVTLLVLVPSLFRMLIWSCKGAEHLSEPSQLSCPAPWDHGSTENQAESPWEVGGTDSP